ncbi:MAG: hypothetical protein ACRDGF_09345 [Chloroflexota bacterium]
MLALVDVDRITAGWKRSAGLSESAAEPQMAAAGQPIRFENVSFR